MRQPQTIWSLCAFIFGLMGIIFVFLGMLFYITDIPVNGGLAIGLLSQLGRSFYWAVLFVWRGAVCRSSAEST